MAKVLLLVKYGSNVGAEITEFKNELKKRGWKKGVLDGVFQKRFLEMPSGNRKNGPQRCR